MCYHVARWWLVALGWGSLFTSELTAAAADAQQADSSASTYGLFSPFLSPRALSSACLNASGQIQLLVICVGAAAGVVAKLQLQKVGGCELGAGLAAGPLAGMPQEFKQKHATTRKPPTSRSRARRHATDSIARLDLPIGAKMKIFLFWPMKTFVK